MTVRTRFAPSPTGMLHLGSVRTALYNYLWAKKNGGTYLLRVEDTDLDRSTEASTAQIFDGFQWLGLNWDEEPVYQSKRLDLYRAALDTLWKQGKIYPAFEAEEELQKAREAAEVAKQTYIYSGASAALPRDSALARMAAGETFVWRLRVPVDGYTEVHETLMGDGDITRFPNSDIGDFPLTRSGTMTVPGMPLYNFCNVVDDHDQRVTHIIRGAEHLVNAAKQVLLYNAFGWDVPTFTHLPLILKNGKKMSKRDPDPLFTVSVAERRAQGYLPEALLNYMALLGWSISGDREFATLEEMTGLFGLDRLSKSNANFDEDKFQHFNAHYIRQLAPDDLLNRVRPFLERAGWSLENLPAGTLQQMVTLAADRARLLADFPTLLQHFFAAPQAYEEGKAEQLFTPAAVTAFRDLQMQLNGASFDAAALEALVKAYMAEKGLKPKDVMMPLRLALTGGTHSPGSVFETMALLGPVATASRLDAAIAVVEK